MVFSNNSTGAGIVEQARDMMRVDSTQWSTQKIVNSCNNWFDKIVGFALATDKRFQWDDTNHTKLPIGTTNLVANQAEYSFAVDEQGNKIITLTRIDVKDSAGNWTQLKPIDEEEITVALDEYEKTAGIPKYYDKIADNIIKLYPKPVANVTSGLKFYFQRTPSYFVSSDTTKEPGCSPLLHRGFVIASAYDGALTLGLANLQPLSVEVQREEQKLTEYFSDRNNDEPSKMKPFNESCR